MAPHANRPPVDPVISKLAKTGASHSVILPKPLLAFMGWQPGSVIAIRTAGEKLILERVPLEQMARIRTGEAQPSPIQQPINSAAL